MVNRNRQKKGACLKYMVDRNRQVRGRVKRYDELLSPSEGACLICDEPLSPNEAACLRYVMNRFRQMRGPVSDIGYTGIANVFTIYDEPESPNKGAPCYKIYGQPDPPHEGVCLRYMVK